MGLFFILHLGGRLSSYRRGAWGHAPSRVAASRIFRVFRIVRVVRIFRFSGARRRVAAVYASGPSGKIAHRRTSNTRVCVLKMELGWSLDSYRKLIYILI